jgi:hypothetical protein
VVSFLAQAERLTARTAAAATEVMIRSFMDLTPLEDYPPTMRDSYTAS